MGVCFCESTQEEFHRIIVTEFMQNKSLDYQLHHKKVKKEKMHSVFKFNVKIRMIIDIVNGIMYLHHHDPPILHRDLKPSVS